MFEYIQSHPAEALLLEYVAFQLFSAIVQSAPDPKIINNIWYTSFINFLSIIAADFKSFISTKGEPHV